MGYHIKPVIKEGLFVSAQNTRKDQLDLVNAKSAFTKFYKEAYFYKLIDNLPDEINQYFLSDMKKQFDLYFKNLFPNVKKAKDKDIAKNLGIGITEERLKIKIDFDKPDKLIKEFYKNSMSQLMHCCSLGSYDYVKRLIKEGADINYTKPYDNYTALIATLENKVDDIKIDIAKYLIPKMSTETINQVLPKKRESALSYAIKKGLVDIVELLIKYGACMKTKVTLDEQIPIYLCLKCISTATKKNFYEVFSFDDKKFIKENPFESKDERKKMIKTHDFGSAVFDHEKEIMFDKMNNDPKHKLIKKAIMKEMPLEFLGYTSNSVNFYKIFDIIVENTKDIDIPHRHGITPLMFATELNEINLVKKLIDKGANIDFYNDENYKAYDYAKANQNQELMELLE
jgi:ankyrin repeat protein